jgi:DNA primase
MKKGPPPAKARTTDNHLEVFYLMTAQTARENLETHPSFIRTLVKVKTDPKASIENYLASEGVELRRGRAKCILHGGKNPHSFHVLTEEQRWRCYACGEYGDLLDLVEIHEKHADRWTALLSLCQRFNIEFPGGSERWHRRQDEKQRIRQAAIKHLTRRYQMRLTKLYAPLVLLGGETEKESHEEVEELGRSLYFVCRDLAERRVNGEL